MTDTLPDLDTSKAMVYKTPNGWVAHCSCGPMLCGSWADAVDHANLRTLTHRNPSLALGVVVLRSMGLR